MMCSNPIRRSGRLKDGQQSLLAHDAFRARWWIRRRAHIVGVPVQDRSRRSCDCTTMVDTLIEAAYQVAAVDGASGIAEVVGDPGV